MSAVKHLRIGEKLILLCITLAWIFLFINLSRRVIENAFAADLTGFLCGLSVGIVVILLYTKIRFRE